MERREPCGRKGICTKIEPVQSDICTCRDICIGKGGVRKIKSLAARECSRGESGVACEKKEGDEEEKKEEPATKRIKESILARKFGSNELGDPKVVLLDITSQLKGMATELQKQLMDIERGKVELKNTIRQLNKTSAVQDMGLLYAGRKYTTQELKDNGSSRKKSKKTLHGGCSCLNTSSLQGGTWATSVVNDMRTHKGEIRCSDVAHFNSTNRKRCPCHASKYGVSADINRVLVRQDSDSQLDALSSTYMPVKKSQCPCVASKGSVSSQSSRRGSNTKAPASSRMPCQEGKGSVKRGSCPCSQSQISGTCSCSRSKAIKKFQEWKFKSKRDTKVSIDLDGTKPRRSSVGKKHSGGMDPVFADYGIAPGAGASCTCSGPSGGTRRSDCPAVNSPDCPCPSKTEGGSKKYGELLKLLLERVKNNPRAPKASCSCSSTKSRPTLQMSRPSTAPTATRAKCSCSSVSDQKPSSSSCCCSSTSRASSTPRPPSDEKPQRCPTERPCPGSSTASDSSQPDVPVSGRRKCPVADKCRGSFRPKQSDALRCPTDKPCPGSPQTTCPCSSRRQQSPSETRTECRKATARIVDSIMERVKMSKTSGTRKPCVCSSGASYRTSEAPRYKGTSFSLARPLPSTSGRFTPTLEAEDRCPTKCALAKYQPASTCDRNVCPGFKEQEESAGEDKEGESSKKSAAAVDVESPDEKTAEETPAEATEEAPEENEDVAEE